MMSTRMMRCVCSSFFGRGHVENLLCCDPHPGGVDVRPLVKVGVAPEGLGQPAETGQPPRRGDVHVGHGARRVGHQGVEQRRLGLRNDVLHDLGPNHLGGAGRTHKRGVRVPSTCVVESKTHGGVLASDDKSTPLARNKTDCASWSWSFFYFYFFFERHKTSTFLFLTRCKWLELFFWLLRPRSRCRLQDDPLLLSSFLSLSLAGV